MRRPSAEHPGRVRTWAGVWGERVARLPGEFAVLLVGVVLFAVSWLPVPYVSLVPGPTVDTLGEFEGQPVLTVSGAPTYSSAGEILFTTVGVYDDLSLADAVGAWFSGSEAVVPRETVYPPGVTRDESDAANEVLFTESESSATAAALRFLGYPTHVVVQDVRENGPSSGVLQRGDVIERIDGEEVTSSAEVIEAVGSKTPGTTVSVAYIRDGVPSSAEIVTEASPTDADRSVIGVTISEEAEGEVNVTVTAKDVGGPSAGLMLSVGIVDELTPEDLTGGRTVAGTGTITAAGTVGSIGGIEQKVVAAFGSGAREFFLPYGNCAAATGNAPDGLRLVPVRTLSETVDILRRGPDADPATLPTCPGGGSG